MDEDDEDDDDYDDDVEMPSRDADAEDDAEDALDRGGALAEADVLFAYSSAFPGDGEFLSDFSRLCGTCLLEGTRVITTDKRLLSVDGLWQFEVLDRLEGTNRETGGDSVGYVQLVTQSQRRE